MSMKRIAANRIARADSLASGFGRSLGAGVLALALSGGAGLAAGPGDKPLPLAPHRAVYDLSLADGGSNRMLTGARGRIAYELTGDACSGYSLEFRQVVVLDRSEGEPEQVEIRSTTHEDAEGGGFRFRQGTMQGEGEKLVQGVARHTGKGDKSGISVDLTRPERRKFSASGDITFPSGHLQRILAAARAGESTVGVRLFEAADDGTKIFDTFAVIGKRAPASPDRPIEEAARKGGLDKVDRWPVSITYYEPGAGERTPVYGMSFDLYENGISGSIRMNYADFTIVGALRSLQASGTGACPTAGKN